jgi:hypothetical protein
MSESLSHHRSQERGGNEPQHPSVRVCIDIDVESAFDQCSAGFSASWKTLMAGQISSVLRPICNPRVVRVAYLDRSV